MNYLEELSINGAKFDVDGYEKVEIPNLHHQLDEYLTSATELLGTPIELNNGYGIVKACADNGIRLERYNMEFLKDNQYKNEVFYNLYNAKKLEQKLKTYSPDKLRAHMDVNNRIHASWYRDARTTGRVYARDPPIQSLPRAAREKYFISEEGYKLVTADYSNMEMRILARLAKDSILAYDLCPGGDVHKATASMIFGVPLSSVDSNMRAVAKAVNFHICYGGSAIGLAERLTIETDKSVSVQEAQDYIDSFYLRYSKVRAYHQKINLGKLTPTTIKGRVFDNLDKIPKRLNYPCQASGAEILVDVLDEVCKTKDKDYKLVMAIHDSITLEVPESKIEVASDYLKQTTEAVMAKAIYPVTALVEIKNFI